jgi:predicted ATP-grasp superfamily ATP-dependent carboligase
MYAHGRVWARFAQEAERMLPPLGGASVLRRSIALPPDVADAAERLVRAMGLEGYSEVEFRRSLDGRPVLMEVNPRLSASIEVAVRAGVDFPMLLYLWAAGEPLPDVGHYRTGVRVRWFGGELRWMKAVFGAQGEPDVPSRTRALAAFGRDSVRPSHYDYLDARDPLPALWATGYFLYRNVLRRGERAPLTAGGRRVA